MTSMKVNMIIAENSQNINIYEKVISYVNIEEKI